MNSAELRRGAAGRCREAPAIRPRAGAGARAARFGRARGIGDRGGRSDRRGGRGGRMRHRQAGCGVSRRGLARLLIDRGLGLRRPFDPAGDERLGSRALRVGGRGRHRAKRIAGVAVRTMWTSAVVAPAHRPGQPGRAPGCVGAARKRRVRSECIVIRCRIGEPVRLAVPGMILQPVSRRRRRARAAPR